jgi:hypothetical protein
LLSRTLRPTAVFASNDDMALGVLAAAQRLGLSFEGVFRQATVYKGRNRDTAWYAATDRDWPALHAAFALWKKQMYACWCWMPYKVWSRRI